MKKLHISTSEFARNICFLETVLEKEDFESLYIIENLINYYKSFKIFIKISVLLNKFYSRDSYNEHDCIEKFIEDYLNPPVSFKKVDQIEALKIKNVNFSKKSRHFSIK